MPHQCTNCGRAFDDGSKEMLSGCPDCGGSTFQFHPDGVDVPEEPPDEPPEPPERPGGKVSRTVGKTAATVRDVVSSGASTPAQWPSTDTPDAPGSDSPTVTGSDPPDAPGEDDIIVAEEDTAQASARTEFARPEELPGDDAEDAAGTESDPPTPAGEDGVDVDLDASADPPAEPTDDERPDLKELREELNDQFESIKVLSPGQYELNLMELYDREEYIIALEEDGRYSIQVPERFQK